MEQAVRIQRVNNWYWDLSQFKFLVRLHGEYNICTCLALWKHHVNLLLQSFRSVSSDLHQYY